MVAIVLIVGVLFAVAVCSAVAVYHLSGSTTWSLEWDKQGMGLSIEVAFLAAVVLVGVAVSIIMNDSFERLYLRGAWHSYPYLLISGVVALGVLIYTLHAAPSTLKDKHNVESTLVHRECRRPYRIYTPYAVILWVVLVLPVPAMVVVSFSTDHGSIVSARRDLAREGDRVLILADREPASAEQNAAIYGLQYQAAVDSLQRTIKRYLWVVGVFVFFLVVILNTRITTVYSEAAQDYFKWFMWFLLALALGICLYGLSEYQAMRDLAITADERLAVAASSSGQLGLVMVADQALLGLRGDDALTFFRGAVVGGVGLIVFSQGIQVMLAKATHRSAMDVVFPRTVARFLHRFLLEGEDSTHPLG